MDRENTKKTKASRTLSSLRQDIIDGRFAPGQKLQMDFLKKRYEVGCSPVREALSQLIVGGFVQLKEQCGFYVAPLSLEELHDLYRMRMHVEILGLELAMEQGDECWEAEAIACWHRYSKYLGRQAENRLDPMVWDSYQKEFSTALVSACQSPWLLKIRDLLYDHALRYRMLCITNHYQNKELLNEFMMDNQNLLSAVLERNRPEAIRVIQHTWGKTLDIISTVLQNRK